MSKEINNFLNGEPVTDEEQGFFEDEDQAFDSLDLLEQEADQAYNLWADNQTQG